MLKWAPQIVSNAITPEWASRNRKCVYKIGHSGWNVTFYSLFYSFSQDYASIILQTGNIITSFFINGAYHQGISSTSSHLVWAMPKLRRDVVAYAGEISRYVSITWGSQKGSRETDSKAEGHEVGSSANALRRHTWGEMGKTGNEQREKPFCDAVMTGPSACPSRSSGVCMMLWIAQIEIRKCYRLNWAPSPNSDVEVLTASTLECDCN